jgi:DNA-binding response OmpR family regulator
MANRVLVVEADDELRRMLNDALTQWGFAVATASSGRQALALLVTEAVGSDPIDGVLLDLELSGLDALVTLRDIRDRHDTLPVVVLSDGADQQRIDTAMRSGAVATVRKPVDLDLLRQIAHVFFRMESPS